MIPKSGHRFPACAKPWHILVLWINASAGVGRSEKIMRKVLEAEECRCTIVDGILGQAEQRRDRRKGAAVVHAGAEAFQRRKVLGHRITHVTLETVAGM